MPARSQATVLVASGAKQPSSTVGVELENKQIQIYGLTDFGRLPIYVLWPRHFFINGSRTLAMCELKYSEHFCPKKIGVFWLCTSNFGIGMYISVSLILALICISKIQINLDALRALVQEKIRE